jgi:hypothetical protein
MPVAFDDEIAVTVRAYLCILIPLASGALCHWRYWQLAHVSISSANIFRRTRYRSAAWFCYGMATSSAILFVTWAVT